MPYAEGGLVTWRARHANHDVDVGPWDVVVEDVSVVEVLERWEEEGTLAIRLAVKSPGQTEVRLWASRERVVLLRRQGVRVAAPDSVRFYPLSEVLTRRGWQDAPSTPPLRLASDGETQFRVVPYAGDEVVHAAPLDVRAEEDATVRVRMEKGRLLEPDVNHLVVEGRGVGPTVVTATSSSRTIQVFTVATHPAREVTGVDILRQGLTRDDEDGAVKYLFARGRLASGETLHGVRASWLRSGESLAGRGDMLEYVLDRGASTEVSAHVGEQAEETTIPGNASAVHSTGRTGCGQAGASPWGWAVVLALAGRVRRRRAFPWTPGGRVR
jgi:hypothetical protein